MNWNLNWKNHDSKERFEEEPPLEDGFGNGLKAT